MAETGGTALETKVGPLPSPRLAADPRQPKGRLRCLWLLLSERRALSTLNPSLRKRFAHRLRRVRWWIYMPLLIAYRFTLVRHVPVIGITGSLGKTTTTLLIARVLAHKLPGFDDVFGSNMPRRVFRNLAFLRPWHRHFVQELTAAIASRRLDLEVPLGLLAPRIGVVTSVATDHWGAFRSQSAIAEEKSKMVTLLPSTGLAVLNADDPWVIAMRAHISARSVTVGTSPDADFRAADVRSSWPDPLRFDLHVGRETWAVRTRLHGAHWVPAVLSAIAVGREMKLGMTDMLEAIAAVEPTPMRLQPEIRADGVAFIRDDFKAPLKSVAPAFELMRDARADRKIAIIGTISDLTQDSRASYLDIARQAREIFDETIFIGMHARATLRANRDENDQSIKAFVSVDAAMGHVATLLRPGDLVLLKGSLGHDNLQRLVDPPETPNHAISRPLGSIRETTGTNQIDFAPMRAIIGLGNPGSKAVGTRHNVGHLVLDRLAEKLGASWSKEERSEIATIEHHGATVHLIKPMTGMNVCGPEIAALSEALGFDTDTMLVVLDETQLSVGEAKTRIHGGAGGHNGLLSVIESMGTDQIRRLKIGIGRPERRGQMVDYVLGPFPETDQPALEKAIGEALAKLESFLPRA